MSEALLKMAREHWAKYQYSTGDDAATLLTSFAEQVLGEVIGIVISTHNPKCPVAECDSCETAEFIERRIRRKYRLPQRRSK